MKAVAADKRYSDTVVADAAVAISVVAEDSVAADKAVVVEEDVAAALTIGRRTLQRRCCVGTDSGRRGGIRCGSVDATMADPVAAAAEAA